MKVSFLISSFFHQFCILDILQCGAWGGQHEMSDHRGSRGVWSRADGWDLDEAGVA